MKKRWLPFVLFAISMMSGFAYGDGGWNPGNPKPPLPSPEGWFSQFGLICRDLWDYMF